MEMCKLADWSGVGTIVPIGLRGVAREKALAGAGAGSRTGIGCGKLDPGTGGGTGSWVGVTTGNQLAPTGTNWAPDDEQQLDWQARPAYKPSWQQDGGRRCSEGIQGVIHRDSD
ncbi:hypothetical protein E4U14_003404 [Claviceps sp. LM454 group G7]|nr:hypothetical protein E4U14_003404 [Claviceps sp. LM454 group G7]